MSFNRLSLVQLIIFIFHYDSVWVPLVTTALSIFKSILAFVGAEVPAYGVHLPLQGVFLPLSGRKPMGAHVGGQDAAGQCVSLRSQFTLIILVSVCYHPYVCRELGFINMNMSPKLTVVTAAVSLLICTSSGCSHHFKPVAPDTTPFLWITNYYKVISAVLNFKKSEC